MSEICQTLKEVLENSQVKTALNVVKTNLPETIEIQKELVLIEAPTGHEETRSKRYKELLISVGLNDVESDEHNNVWGWIRGSEKKGTVSSWKAIWILFSHSEMSKKLLKVQTESSIALVFATIHGRLLLT